MKSPQVKFKRNGEIVLIKKYEILIPHWKFTLPKGFVSDGASIPWYVQWFGDPYDGDTLPGALIHDSLYRSKGAYTCMGETFRLSRKGIDSIFLMLMEENRVYFIKRSLYFIMVRAFGIIPWLFGKPKKPSLTISLRA